MCPGSRSCRDYWNDQEKPLNIATKETLALFNALKAPPSEMVDAFVDSKGLIDEWEGQGSKRSPELTSVTKELSFVLSTRNVQISLTHVLQGKTLRMGLHEDYLA